MLNPDDILVLRQLFQAEDTDLILGARIGDIVKRNYPDVSIKKEFGSLGGFIQTHFSDLMIFRGKHGNDNEYILSSKNIANVTDDQNLTTITENTPSNKSNDTVTKGVAMAQKRALYNADPLQSNVDTLLRHAIKSAVDVMTLEQLRQLVLPAGILFDAISKTNRT